MTNERIKEILLEIEETNLDFDKAYIFIATELNKKNDK